MREWLSPGEIASLALTGMPRTKREVLAIANNSGWFDSGRSRVRKKPAVNGFEFHYTLLPPAALSDYLCRHSKERPRAPVEAFDWRLVSFPPSYRLERLFECCDSKTFYNFKGSSVRIEYGWFDEIVAPGWRTA